MKLADKFKTVNQSPQLTVADEIEDLLRDEEQTIFEKNKWIKKVNMLSPEGIRETIESQEEGPDTFSSDYTFAEEKLSLLGNMGKNLS